MDMHHKDLFALLDMTLWYNVQKCIQDKSLVKYHDDKPGRLLLFDITPNAIVIMITLEIQDNSNMFYIK